MYQLAEVLQFLLHPLQEIAYWFPGFIQNIQIIRVIYGILIYMKYFFIIWKLYVIINLGNLWLTIGLKMSTTYIWPIIKLAQSQRKLNMINHLKHWS